MNSFSFIAVDNRGSQSRGSLEVASQAEALLRIKEMGLFPLRVTPTGGMRPWPKGVPGKKGKRPGACSDAGTPDRGLSRLLRPSTGTLRPGTLSVFTRQLATLTEAGMPLLRGLRTLRAQENRGALRRIIDHLAEAVEGGATFADALGRHPRAFSPMYVNMVKAGEVGGFLDTALRRLADSIDRAQKLKSRVRGALIYPCAVLLVAGAILGLLMVFVVPSFQRLFVEMLEGAQLPAFSRFVFRISSAISGHPLLLLAGLGAVPLGMVLARKTAVGRAVLDRMVLAVPILGRLLKLAAIGRFARTLGTLLGSGVPILQALTIVRQTAGNVVYSRAIADMHRRVKEGDPLAPGLRDAFLFPSMVVGMVDVGEQTGALPDLLLKVADNCDDQVDTAAGALTTVLEPALIVVLAVVVGSIVVALFLPLLQLMNGFGDPIGQPGN